MPFLEWAPSHLPPVQVSELHVRLLSGATQPEDLRRTEGRSDTSQPHLDGSPGCLIPGAVFIIRNCQTERISEVRWGSARALLI